MRVQRPWTPQPIHKVTAGILAGILLLSATGCKKQKSKSAPYNKSEKYVSGKEILETDPYFDAEVCPLQIPLREGQKVETLYFLRCEYEDGIVVANYQVAYETPEGAEFQEFYNNFENVTALFDEKGNYIKGITSEGDIYDMAADNDGNICILKSYNDFKEEKMGVMLSVFDRQGNTIKEIKLQDPPVTGDGRTVPSFSILPDGRYAVCGMGMLDVYDQDGNKVSEISDFDRSIDGEVLWQDGKSYVLSAVYGEYGQDDLKIKEVDLNTGKLGDEIEAGFLSSYGTPVSTDNGLFVRSRRGCFSCDIKTGEVLQVFDWNDTDVPGNILYQSKIYPQSSDELYVVGQNDFANICTAYVIHLSRAEKNPHAGKRMIVIGGANMSTDSELMAFLDAYNHDTSAKARAVLVDYYDGLGDEYDPGEVEKAIYLDFLSGNGPDILYGFADSAVFCNSEVMADLNTYIDGPNGLSRDDYFDNILRACEKDGKLYHMPLRVTLSGMQVNTKYIDNRTGWTYDEFEEAAQNLPEQVSFIEAKEYEYLLSCLLMANPKFVNYDKKTVDFQNDEMKRLLQLAKTYGVKELPPDEGEKSTHVGDGIYLFEGDLTREKFKEDLLAAVDSYILSISNYADDKKNAPENTAFLGYPSADGSGMSCIAHASMGIVATSKYTDLAWDLLRSFMQFYNPNEQMQIGLSVNKTVFEEECRKDMERENHTYERAKKELSFDPSALDLFVQISESDIDELRDLLCSVTRCEQINTSVLNIVLEEAAGYFAGDRTEDEVLATIQNRARNVVNEM